MPSFLFRLSFCLSFWIVLSSLAAEPQVKIVPAEVTLEETFNIQVTHALPESKVRIDAWLLDAANRWWTSSAQFKADKDGGVNTAKQAPLSGSYSGIDPMGLLWSMSLPASVTQRTSYWHSSLEPMTVFFEILLEDGTVLKDKLVRNVARNDLQRTEIRENGIVGFLLAPPSEKPLPAVIVLGGSEGGLPAASYVAQFANAGFVALGLAYFKEKDLPDYLSEIPIEYFQKTAAWLAMRSEVDPTRMGIVGTSIGGTAALLAATVTPSIRSVVTFNGGGVIFQSIDPNPNIRKRDQSSFSMGGTPLPFVPISVPPPNAESLTTSYYLRVFLGSLYATDQSIIATATIPVETINGPVLLLSGQADRLMGSPTLNEIVYERLAAKHFGFAFEMRVFNGAGHNIGGTALPWIPATLSQELIGSVQMPYSFGGIAKDIAKARSLSWAQCLEFLKANLKETDKKAKPLSPKSSPTPSPKEAASQRSAKGKR